MSLSPAIERQLKHEAGKMIEVLLRKLGIEVLSIETIKTWTATNLVDAVNENLIVAATTPVTSNTHPNTHPNEKFPPLYGIDDWVKLAVRPGTVEKSICEKTLANYGEWWKVKSGRGSRGEGWLLQSVANQHRNFSKKEITDLPILKAGDARYAVIAYLKFPCEWNYKRAEAMAAGMISDIV